MSFICHYNLTRGIIALLLFAFKAGHALTVAITNSTWLLNEPPDFRSRASRITQQGLRDMWFEDTIMDSFRQTITKYRSKKNVDTGTDLELIDAIEHFFWGHMGGLSLEIGALDGTVGRDSVTADLETLFDWSRILIEANPKHRKWLAAKNPNAYSISAAICDRPRPIHFGFKKKNSGIIEFMALPFVQKYFPAIYKMYDQAKKLPYGGPVDGEEWWRGMPWKRIMFSRAHGADVVSAMNCIRLSEVLAHVGVTRIHFFVLDVEGSELSVLKTIQWEKIQFDVLCIETDTSFRPAGFAAAVQEYLESKGYVLAASRGRNSWFRHKDFTPSVRPGVNPDCFRGVQTVANVSKTYLAEVDNAHQPNCRANNLFSGG